MNATDEKQVLEFKSLLEELRKQLLDACVHFDIWVQLFPTAQVVDVINQYVGFFQPTREAHLDRFFIKVSNVVSNDPLGPPASIESSKCWTIVQHWLQGLMLGHYAVV